MMQRNFQMQSVRFDFVTEIGLSRIGINQEIYLELVRWRTAHEVQSMIQSGLYYCQLELKLH